MLFVLIAKDGKDKDALNRRISMRDQHISMGNDAVKKGEQLLGCALLDEKQNMCGSVMLVEFDDREALDNWLKKEPYVTGNVWQDIEIYPCNIGPSFQHIFQKT